MSVTAVPIHPIKKGTLTKLWVGIALLFLAAGGLAWAGQKTMPAINLITLTPGEGPSPVDGDVTLVNYTGKLQDGTVFDSGERAPIPVQGVVPGFSQGLKMMQKGGKYTLEIPADLAYGATRRRAHPFPPMQDLTFDVELLDFKSEAEIRALQEQMQQLQQQGAIPGIAPGAEPGAPGDAAPMPAPGQ